VASEDGRLDILVNAAGGYPETELLRQVEGVGALTALTFVLTLEDPHRFERSRSVGAYLGLVPARDHSGDRDPQRCASQRKATRC
jgi:transposase